MPRQLRLEYKGAVYHVMARGDRREAIFHGEEDRLLWLKTLGEACERTGWKVYGWVLMDNHYHMLLQTPVANLVAGMQWLQTTFTIRMNARHGWSGHLFGGRYKAVLVESGESSGGEEQSSHPFGYMGTVLDYIHLNPVRAGMFSRSKKVRRALMDYPWSSLRRGYLQMPQQRQAWLDVKTGLSLFGLKDTAHGRREFLNRLETRRREEGKAAGEEMPEGQSLQSTLQRGWYFGSQNFRERMLSLLPKKGRVKKTLPRRRRHEAAGMTKDHGREQAEQIIRQFLKKHHQREKSFLDLAPSSPQKARLAARLHRETTVKLQWIAQRLKMKSESNVCHIIRRYALSRCKT